MTYLAAGLFFTVALLAAAVAIHMTVRTYWTEIMLALKGEYGPGAKRQAEPAARAYVLQKRAAA